MKNELYKANKTQYFYYLMLPLRYRSADGHPPNAPSLLEERGILQNRSSFKCRFC